MSLIPILVIFIVIVIWKIYDYVYKVCLINKIPGPKSWPVIGNAHNVLLPFDILFSFVRKLPKMYGGIFQLHACNVRTINISNPEDVKIILSSNYSIQRDFPYTFLKPWLHEGLLLSNGSKWRNRRKLLSRAFHFNILNKYFCVFTEQTQKFLVNLKAEIGKDKTNVIPLVSKAALDIIYETTMNPSSNNRAATANDGTTGHIKYFNGVEMIGHTTVQRLVRPWLYADIIFRHSKIGTAQKNAVKDVHDFTMKIIRDRKSYLCKNTSPTNFECENMYRREFTMLDMLLKNEKEGKINIEGVREEVDTIMFGGFDTITMALSFMIMRIANEPIVQNKIYEEMKSIFGQSLRSATMEDINRMKYLDCCIKESLRIYPSAPYISRYISKEMVLSGYKIPAGTICNIHIYDIHHSDQLFPDPDKFIPERFLPENSAMRHPFAFIPFSAGARNCIGQKFAMLEMKVIMSNLIRRFRLEPVTKPEAIIFTCHLVLRATHPIFVQFRPRGQEEAKE